MATDRTEPIQGLKCHLRTLYTSNVAVFKALFIHPANTHTERRKLALIPYAIQMLYFEAKYSISTIQREHGFFSCCCCVYSLVSSWYSVCGGWLYIANNYVIVFHDLSTSRRLFPGCPVPPRPSRSFHSTSSAVVRLERGIYTMWHVAAAVNSASMNGMNGNIKYTCTQTKTMVYIQQS